MAVVPHLEYPGSSYEGYPGDGQAMLMWKNPSRATESCLMDEHVHLMNTYEKCA